MEERMKILSNLRALATLLMFGIVAAACNEAEASGAGNTEVTAYLTPTCGCCLGWVEHMRANGFTVNVVYQDDLSDVRREHGVPVELTSCHLGVVEGYAIEGHVPADVVTRFLRERPELAGIAVPGMVVGTPGMEHPDGHVDPYEIVSFDENGPVGVYESRR
jgi:hypothetical protein